MSSRVDPAEALLRHARRVRTAYRDVFTSPSGRVVLNDLLKEGGILTVSHTPGDPHDTAFNEGRRSMALHVLDKLRWSEGQIETLAQERTTETIFGPTGEN